MVSWVIELGWVTQVTLVTDWPMYSRYARVVIFRYELDWVKYL